MKRIKITLLSACYVIILCGQQNLDILTISGRYGFPKSYDSILSGKAKETGSMINLVAPIKFSNKTIWYNSVNYFYWHVSNNENLPSDIADPINMHGIIVRTGLYQKFKNGQAFQLFFAPRLMSDFKNIDYNSFQFGGVAMYEKKYRESLTLAFGAMYNQELFGPYFVPLINLNWELTDRWSITGLLPVYAKIKYQQNERLSVGISHFGLITTYYLGAEEYRSDYMQRSSIDLGLFARYKLIGDIYVEARFGHSFGRSYAQYEADQKVDFAIPLVAFGDDRVQKNVTFEDGFIASLRLVYNIEIPEGK